MKKKRPGRSYLYFFALLPCFLFISSPAYSDSWLEFFFPSLKEKRPDPSETLQAPFADGDQVITAPSVEGVLGENSTPLHIRHRPSADIADWVEDTLPDLMSYSSAKYKEEYKFKVLNLSKTAKADYLKFLQDANFLKTLDTGQYDIKAFAEEIPIILNEGDVEGRYRWLYKVRMMVTYVTKGAKDYKIVQDSEAITQSMFVTVQVGRVKTKDLPKYPEGVTNEHSVLIESFNVKIIENKKK
ncbi:MAG: DotI/IcmL family type IV secretion protein [Alphaproteobacteria bacterium]|nr:DotI/IcmL family type IV secretion protein [Alphaproteobacteria bacterium]MBP7757906.1 DotI/IcmL family type IV secretion protein [Alphaproteobacteria bacterium]MBP7761233.1 DotI/IcmL family type IV secretion protein [Alphaproteobacteria bacterium]MBP7904804.1 DotI/IcmL family type IV secretion protein [Alphaproteobacteria bacterium]